MTPAPFDEPIHVTRPVLPPLENYIELLRGIWERRWLTNKGEVHDALEAALATRLGVEHLSLLGNGTLALLVAFRALGLTGEVVTTPFTFPATIGALVWAGLEPVFADIDPERLTIDPAAVERAITPRTSAILGVHVYGRPCEVDALAEIAARRRLRVIYDGAHTFGGTLDGRPLYDFGDATTLSFHATKLFNTAEGGAVIAASAGLKQRIDLMKNVGIAGEASVPEAGINARMNELTAALGLANLGLVDAELADRAAIDATYRLGLADIPGLRCLDPVPGASQPLAYFPVRIEAGHAAVSRDALYERLKRFNVFARRYFHPLCSDLPPYAGYASSHFANLPAAHRAAAEVLCLPFYGALGVDAAHRICEIIRHLQMGASAS